MSLLIAGIAVGAGIWLYYQGEAVRNNTVVFTIGLGIAMIWPAVGAGIMITTLLFNILFPVIEGETITGAVLYKKFKPSLGYVSGVIAVIGTAIVLSLYSGVVLAWLTFGNATMIISLLLIINNIRIAISDCGPAVTTLNTIFLSIISGVVLLISNAAGIHTIVAIVVIIFGMVPGSKVKNGILNGGRVSRYRQSKESSVLGSGIELVKATALAVGGVNPYLLINGRQNNKLDVIFIAIAAELVPLGKWLAGKDTGKSLVTELLKAGTIDTIGITIGILILVLVLVLVFICLKDLVIKAATVANAGVCEDNNQFVELLVILFLGLMGGGVIAAAASVLLFVAFRFKDGALMSFLPPALSTTLPCSIIMLS